MLNTTALHGVVASHALQNINNTFDGTTNLMAAVPVTHAPTKSMQKRGVNQTGLNKSNHQYH